MQVEGLLRIIMITRTSPAAAGEARGLTPQRLTVISKPHAAIAVNAATLIDTVISRSVT